MSEQEALKPELLRCPFCGSPGATHENDWCEPPIWDAYCTNPACHCRVNADTLTEAEAITAWNRRAQPSAADLRRALEPIIHYVAMRRAKPLRGLGDDIHGIHTGTEWEAALRWPDIQRIADLFPIPFPADPAPAREDGAEAKCAIETEQYMWPVEKTDHNGIYTGEWENETRTRFKLNGNVAIAKAIRALQPTTDDARVTELVKALDLAHAAIDLLVDDEYSQHPADGADSECGICQAVLEARAAAKAKTP